METEKERQAPNGGFSGQHDEIVHYTRQLGSSISFRSNRGVAAAQKTVHY